MRQTRVNPDVALLAGLLHGVGKLYILMRLQELPRLLLYPETCGRILREWHGGVARAILENWGVPDEVGEAVQEFESLDRDLLRTASLSEVLTAASLFALFRANRDTHAPLDEGIARLVSHNTRFWQRLHIDAPLAQDLLTAAEAEIEALHAVLGH
jgi:HD-like signal output (HDOD) protein